MNITKYFELIITLLTISGMAYALWKAIKMKPREIQKEDADTSLSYAQAAKLAGEQMTAALIRIGQLETKATEVTEQMAELKILLRDQKEILAQRDKCIDRLNKELARRDKLIHDWAEGIKVLTGQLIGAKIIPGWIPHDLNGVSDE